MRWLCAIGWHDWITRDRYVHGWELKCFDCGRVRFRPTRKAAAKYGGGLWLSPDGPKGKETFEQVEVR